MNNKSKLEKVGFVLVLLMILLQGFYGIFAYIDPLAFSTVRGTELFALMDADWVNIYGSRTIFITLVLGLLLYSRHYSMLMWCALFGIIMPVTDAVLAYQAGAPFMVIFKHIATIVYLVIIFFVLKRVTVQKVNNIKR
ncbi:MAG: DUF4267 domain-containing protein [Colwellia sp.]|nr:DUF4267 domain-containing protein [Colwellia sp.]